jgi:hypothetical protein
MAEVGSLIRAEQAAHVAIAAVWVLIEADWANLRLEELVLRLCRRGGTHNDGR